MNWKDFQPIADHLFKNINNSLLISLFIFFILVFSLFNKQKNPDRPTIIMRRFIQNWRGNLVMNVLHVFITLLIYLTNLVDWETWEAPFWFTAVNFSDWHVPLLVPDPSDSLSLGVGGILAVEGLTAAVWLLQRLIFFCGGGEQLAFLNFKSRDKGDVIVSSLDSFKVMGSKLVLDPGNYLFF